MIDLNRFRNISDYARSTQSYGELLQQPPKYLFLCYVALCQIPDKSIDSEDRYSCQIYGCNLSFRGEQDRSSQLLRHVSNCPLLGTGIYHCHSCGIPEVFMAPENPTHSDIHRHSRRHFLKHAFDAICRLGTRKLRRPHLPKGNSSRSLRASKKRRYVEEMPELGGECHPSPTTGERVELQGARSIPVDTKRPTSLSAFELPDSSLWPLEMHGSLPEHVHPSTLESSVPELSSQRFSYPSGTHDSMDDATPDCSLSPAVSPATNSECFFNSDGFDSPISPADLSRFTWSLDAIDRVNPITSNLRLSSVTSTFDFEDPPSTSSSPVKSGSWHSEGRSTRPYPNIRIDTSCSTARPVLQPSPSSSTGGLQRPSASQAALARVPSPLQIEAEERSPTRLVKELRGLFNNVVKVSMSKLGQPPISPSIATLFKDALGGYTTAATIFDTSFHALEKIAKGVIPTTLRELFGLSHLVYATALASHQADIAELLPEIFSNLQDWSHAIISNQERATYLHLIKQLFSPEQSGFESATTQHSRYAARYFKQPLPSMPPPPAPWPTVAEPGENLAILQQEFRDEDQMLNSLKKGIAIRLCLDYLSSKSSFWFQPL